MEFFKSESVFTDWHPNGDDLGNRYTLLYSKNNKGFMWTAKKILKNKPIDKKYENILQDFFKEQGKTNKEFENYYIKVVWKLIHTYDNTSRSAQKIRDDKKYSNIFKLEEIGVDPYVMPDESIQTYPVPYMLTWDDIRYDGAILKDDLFKPVYHTSYNDLRVYYSYNVVLKKMIKKDIN